MIKSQIKLDGPARLLDAYYNALEPEQDFKTERASYFLKKTKGYLNITIEAKDVTALRAIVNTVTGVLAIVYKTWKVKNDSRETN